MTSGHNIQNKNQKKKKKGQRPTGKKALTKKSHHRRRSTVHHNSQQPPIGGPTSSPRHSLVVVVINRGVRIVSASHSSIISSAPSLVCNIGLIWWICNLKGNISMDSSPGFQPSSGLGHWALFFLKNGPKMGKKAQIQFKSTGSALCIIFCGLLPLISSRRTTYRSCWLHH
ncbi:Hypothetical predicted protein [Olea europaea subsp. europaea]|uniref:Uncharacterized protein n=1 Tax=Olea europaea subsp. europaea TaxID=158383 RepID=A0A8S0QHS2_OLEEU|nr:Hypothetical predicted protein [Olea europaea subsp. europaea]